MPQFMDYHSDLKLPQDAIDGIEIFTAIVCVDA